MNITLMAFGSRGDVQPFLALAVALRGRGHAVTLAAPSDFEAQITAYGISYVRIPINNMDVYQQDASKRYARRMNPLTAIALWRELMPQIKRALLSTAYLVAEAASGADLLISHGLLFPVAYSIHQHLKIPLIMSMAAPVVPTGEFSVAFPPLPFGGRFYNLFTYQALWRGLLSISIGPMNDYRKSAGLPTLSAGKIIQILSSGEVPIMLHFSRHICPPPSDWHANVHVVGAWPLSAPADWTPPEALTDFLEKGDPPIYVGFGSMPISNPPQTAQNISESLRAANLRGVLQAGWGGLEHEADHLITIGDAPHEWLFPRMSAFVHHGGSGTTHSALSTGKPALIVPFMADQPFWGRRLAALGVGVPAISPKKLTTERLTNALHQLTQDNAMRQRANALGELLRAEDGLTAACNLAEHYAH